MAGKGWLIIVLGVFLVWLSGTPVADRIVDWLAAQPQLGDTLTTASPGAREQALSLLFVCMFVAPLGVLVIAGLAAVLLALLVDAARPAAQALALGDTAARATIMAVLVSAAWLARDAWLPRSLWMLGLLARAYRVAVT